MEKLDMLSEKISIVVPVYNLEQHIQRCVESICNQTYKNIEIILVDDGSSDNSYKKIQELAKNDDRIKVLHQENSGVTKARLSGIKIASGEWIGFVDGDDSIDIDMYERLLNNAKKYDAQVSHCGYKMVFPSRTDYYYNTGRTIVQNNSQGLKDLVAGLFVEPGLWNKLFHKSLFNGLLNDNFLDLSIKNLEDLLMNYFLFRESQKSIYEDFCPYNYIVRENSAATSKININKLIDPIKVFEIIKNCENNNTEIVEVVNARLLAKFISNATIKIDNQSELILPIRKNARKHIQKNLLNILKGTYSIKLKVSSVLVAVWPFFYSFFHKLYSKMKGTDNKYKVN